ncbi:MAG: hypothetical protein QOE06_292 [Thermoleophilaceae bacterium]|nr:hypothetical protein [Thermoleophilaceae bacterium]
MLRRRRFSLPFEDQLPALTRAVRGEPVPEPAAPGRLVDAALHHRVAGHVARAVEREELRLPGPQRRRLARIGAVQIAHSMALRRELGELAVELEAACGTAPICIKGPAVADRLYPDPRLRTFADLDLMLPRERLDTAAAALERRGYEHVHEFRPGFGASHGHDLHLARRAGARAINVELHWRVGDDPACAALGHGVLAGEERIDVGGAAVAVPAAPAQILVLAVHLLSDRSKRLVWLEDLALAGRAASDREWLEAFELAERLELGWVLHRALDYVGVHLGWERARPLPPGPAPAWGPLRAVEALDMRGSLHLGRMAALDWPGRRRYLRTVLVPTREGLAGTVGGDGAPLWRLAARHVRVTALALAPRRR